MFNAEEYERKRRVHRVDVITRTIDQTDHNGKMQFREKSRMSFYYKDEIDARVLMRVIMESISLARNDYRRDRKEYIWNYVPESIALQLYYAKDADSKKYILMEEMIDGKTFYY